jgi:hypothetical protein
MGQPLNPAHSQIADPLRPDPNRMEKARQPQPTKRWEKNERLIRQRDDERIGEARNVVMDNLW